MKSGAGENSGGQGNGYGIKHEADNVVQGNHLKQGLDKITFCAGLPDGHDGGSGSSGRGQRAQNHRKRKVQAENQVTGQKNENGGAAGFKHRNGDDFSAVFLQGGKAEKLTGAEGDKSQGNIRKEGGSFHNCLRD